MMLIVLIQYTFAIYYHGMIRHEALNSGGPIGIPFTTNHAPSNLFHDCFYNGYVYDKRKREEGVDCKKGVPISLLIFK